MAAALPDTPVEAVEQRADRAIPAVHQVVRHLLEALEFGRYPGLGFKRKLGTGHRLF
jgi:hypothetical protein